MYQIIERCSYTVIFQLNLVIFLSARSIIGHLARRYPAAAVQSHPKTRFRHRVSPGLSELVRWLPRGHWVPVLFRSNCTLTETAWIQGYCWGTYGNSWKCEYIYLFLFLSVFPFIFGGLFFRSGQFSSPSFYLFLFFFFLSFFFFFWVGLPALFSSHSPFLRKHFFVALPKDCWVNTEKQKLVSHGVSNPRFLSAAFQSQVKNFQTKMRKLAWNWMHWVKSNLLVHNSIVDLSYFFCRRIVVIMIVFQWYWFQLGQPMSSGSSTTPPQVQGLHDSEILTTVLTHFAGFTSRTTLGAMAVAGVVRKAFSLFFLWEICLYISHLRKNSSLKNMLIETR